MTQRAHHFDLSKNGASDGVHTLQKGGQESVKAVLERVAAAVRAHTEAQLASTERAVPILRIVLLNFGSGLWEPADQLMFLSRLRAVMRASLATCLVAMPRLAVSPAVRHCFDQSVALSEFNTDVSVSAEKEGER